MVVLSSQLKLLYAVFQNILYIQRPTNSTEAFVCFDTNWTKMIPHLINQVPVFYTSVPNNINKFRIKMKFNDDVIKELNLNNISSNDTVAEPSIVGLLCYLTLCSTVLLRELLNYEMYCVLEALLKPLSGYSSRDVEKYVNGIRYCDLYLNGVFNMEEFCAFMIRCGLHEQLKQNLCDYISKEIFVKYIGYDMWSTNKII